VWLSATYLFDLSWAYLLSLICAISVYLAASLIERRFQKGDGEK
jgi:hypothetical protein